MVVAVVAFIAATAGTALAATGQLVNIADPTNAARLAKVDAGGRLNVGDGSGPLTVDGIVNQRETPPTTPMYFSTGINIGDGFIKIATSPANKALVIKSLFLNTYSNPSPGQAQNVQFYIGPTGSGPLAPIVAEINPPGLGLDSANVESGIIVPATSSLYADGNGSVQGLVYGFGYIVASSSGPAMTYVTPPS
jgi:hypothetical protein